MQTPDPDITPNRSIARRLFIGAALWSLAALTIGVLVLGTVYRAQLLGLLEDELRTTVQELSVSLDNVEVEQNGEVVRDGRVSTIDERLPSGARFERIYSGWYWSIIAIDNMRAPDETRMVRSNSLFDGDPPVDTDILPGVLANPGKVFFGNSIGPNDEPLRVAMMALRFDNRPNPVLLVAAADRSGSDAASDRFRLFLIGAMVVLAGGLLAALLLQIRLGLAPLRRLETDLVDIREGERTRLDGDYPREVYPLTRELNKLIDHNGEVVERAKTHVGNLAHALKTPIAVMLNEASGDSQLEDLVRRQCQSMQQNVQHYLKRAQAAARAEVLGARTLVAPVAGDLARLLMRLFQDKGVAIDVDVPDTVAFRGERQDLEEILGNLLENACKWCTSRVEVRAERLEGVMVLSVEDDGPGLTEDQRDTALKRGARLDEAAQGTGLGLSIVTELVEIHRGTLDLGRGNLGGLLVRMEFPTR